MTDQHDSPSPSTDKQDSPIAGAAAQRPQMTSEEMIDHVQASHRPVHATARAPQTTADGATPIRAQMSDGPRAHTWSGGPATQHRRDRGPWRRRSPDDAPA